MLLLIIMGQKVNVADMLDGLLKLGLVLVKMLFGEKQQMRQVMLVIWDLILKN